MIRLGGLDEALDAPLLQEPLKLDPAQLIERGQDAHANLPAPEEIPVVSIGMPRAWAVTAPLPAQQEPIGAMVRAETHIGPNERALVLRMACSFRPRSDRTQIVWARFMAQLFADNQQLSLPIALDLYPLSVEVERRVTRRVALSPSLKLMEVEVGLGEAEFIVDYPAVEPIISASGFQSDLVSWDFNEANGQAIYGGKLLIAVVAVSSHVRRLEVASSIQADLRHRGMRLPTWLGGRTPRAQDARRAVAWQDGES